MGLCISWMSMHHKFQQVLSVFYFFRLIVNLGDAFKSITAAFWRTLMLSNQAHFSFLFAFLFTQNLRSNSRWHQLTLLLTIIWILILLFCLHIDNCFSRYIQIWQKCGRVEEQIELLKQKLRMIFQGEAFNGKHTKTARSHGRKFQVTIKQETSRILVSTKLREFIFSSLLY